jgi:hypothetical protein
MLITHTLLLNDNCGWCNITMNKEFTALEAKLLTFNSDLKQCCAVVQAVKNNILATKCCSLQYNV